LLKILYRRFNSGFGDKFVLITKMNSMKKILPVLPCLLITGLLFGQTQSVKPPVTSKILLSPGQKIIVENVVSMESSMSPGMDMSNNSVSENTLEVKSSTDKNYTLSSTLTKLKMELNMMGQNTSYDSEKKEDQASEIGKSVGDRLNKPSEVILDNSTGIASLVLKKKESKGDADDPNPMQGILKMFDNSSDDGIVSGAFELIPPGKDTGDTWADSTVEKDMKMVRNYKLRSLNGNEALIELHSVIDAVNTLELQGMQVDMNSSTKSTSLITADVVTGQVRKKSTTAEITGSFQVMGQSVPLSAKVSNVSTYK
jgi:hypothetical protein